MKTHWILILLILSFLSCNKTQKNEIKEEPILELIAYNWSSYNNPKSLISGDMKDTPITYVQCNLYAHIYKNGNCMVSKNRGIYQNEQYSTLNLNTALINPVLEILNTIENDTLMIDDNKLGDELYDGPLIRIIWKNDDKEFNIDFNDTRHSNINLVNLYKHINTEVDKIGSNDKLILSKEKRLNEIYNMLFDKDLKTLKKTNQFTPPENK